MCINLYWHGTLCGGIAAANCTPCQHFLCGSQRSHRSGSWQQHRQLKSQDYYTHYTHCLMYQVVLTSAVVDVKSWYQVLCIKLKWHRTLCGDELPQTAHLVIIRYAVLRDLIQVGPGNSTDSNCTYLYLSLCIYIYTYIHTYIYIYHNTPCFFQFW